MIRELQVTNTKGMKMTTFERRMLIEDCREACRHNVERTNEEAARVREKAAEACRKLGIEYPEDAFKS